MIPRYHPSEDRLLEHATGALDSGARLVIATHLRACAACAAKIRLAEAVGGVLMDELSPVELRSDALAHALARLERPGTPLTGDAGAGVQHPDWISVPSIVLDAARRRRRWAAPGVWVAPVTGVASGARTYLLRVGPGMSVPRHTHRGAELVCVLKGAFADGDTVHGPGDFAESDETVDHKPMITHDGECICLIFADGRLVPRDWVGHVFQPIVRI